MSELAHILRLCCRNHTVIVAVAALAFGRKEPSRAASFLLSRSCSLKTALENECESNYVQTGPGKWYSTSTTLRVQSYGQPNERKLAPDEGSGYIWRLLSIARYEEADGGVYVEVEAMALSREIPAAMRLAVDPIVRRVSKGPLITSLKQTQGAVSSSAQNAATRPIPIPVLASGFIQSQH
ncbi:MAG: hypothetical protein ABSB35_23305 [Bryobacteraceae bacterium]|jgi:hypothetical protein